jgi:hypothetical protein
MEERVRRLLEAVDLVLIRHGKTSKAIDDSPEADKARWACRPQPHWTGSDQAQTETGQQELHHLILAGVAD